MKSMKNSMSKSAKYLECGGSLVKEWEIMSSAERSYARYLVKRYAYTAKMAIQRAFIFGFDARPYDYRNDTITRETASAAVFGF